MKSELFNFDTPRFGKVRARSTADVFSSSLSSCFCQAAFVSDGQKLITHTLVGERSWSCVTVRLECAEAAWGGGWRVKGSSSSPQSAGLGWGSEAAFSQPRHFGAGDQR